MCAVRLELVQNGGKIVLPFAEPLPQCHSVTDLFLAKGKSRILLAVAKGCAWKNYVRGRFCKPTPITQVFTERGVTTSGALFCSVCRVSIMDWRVGIATNLYPAVNSSNKTCRTRKSSVSPHPSHKNLNVLECL